jgi:hypothetical protein
MASPVYIGRQGVVYYTTSARTYWTNTSSSINGIVTGAAPQSLLAMNVVRNVNTANNYSEADGSMRLSSAKLSIPALLSCDPEFDIPWYPTDPGFMALRNLFWEQFTNANTQTCIGLAILDGLIASSGSQGVWGDFCVMDFPRDEPLEKEMMSKVKLKLTPSAVPPQYVVVN